MTEERRAKYNEYTKRLENIKKWSMEHREEWIKICFSPSHLTLDSVMEIKEDCIEKGFMELYLMLLMQVAYLSNLKIGTEHFDDYIDKATYKHLRVTQDNSEDIANE